MAWECRTKNCKAANIFCHLIDGILIFVRSLLSGPAVRYFSKYTSPWHQNKNRSRKRCVRQNLHSTASHFSDKNIWLLMYSTRAYRNIFVEDLAMLSRYLHGCLRWRHTPLERFSAACRIQGNSSLFTYQDASAATSAMLSTPVRLKWYVIFSSHATHSNT